MCDMESAVNVFDMTSRPSSAFELSLSLSDDAGENISLHTQVYLVVPTEIYRDLVLLRTRFTMDAITSVEYMDTLRHLLLPLQTHLHLLDDCEIMDAHCTSFVRVFKHLLRDELLASPLGEEDGWDLLQCDLSVGVGGSREDAQEPGEVCFPVDLDECACEIKLVMWLYFHVSLDLKLLDSSDHFVLKHLNQDITSSEHLSSEHYLSIFVPIYVLLWTRSGVDQCHKSEAVVALLELVLDIVEDEDALGCTLPFACSAEDVSVLCPLPAHALLLHVLVTLHHASLITLEVIDFLLRRIIDVDADSKTTSSLFFSDGIVAFLMDQCESVIFPSQVSYLNYCTTIAKVASSYMLHTSHGALLSRVLADETLVKIAKCALYAEAYEVVQWVHKTLLSSTGPCTGLLNACLLNSTTGYTASSSGSVETWDALHDFMGTSSRISMICESDEILEKVPHESLYKMHALLRESAKMSSMKDAQGASPRGPPFTAELSDCFQNGVIPLALAQLGPLHTLTLSHNEISIFPEQILSLVNLVRLNLSWNKLSSVPKSISASLGCLQVLDISHNALTEFPKCILKLRSLVELYLQDNGMEEIRNDILLLDKLRHLDISNNRLKAIPPRLNQSLKLVYFRFSGNPLLYNSTGSSG
jgi:hypothetical protein